MNKLEVGMYVRTKKGIVKIKEVIDNGVITYEDDFGREWEEETGRKVIRYIDKDGWNCGLDEKEILKASHNIIDLIEVGDVITTNNLCGQVTCIDGEKIYTTCYDGECCYDYHIQSIVTKEQFSSMEYRLGK